MKLNKDTDYAIRIVLLCEEYSTERISADFIVETCKVPKRWGKIILTKLTTNKILKSTKGKNGGFEINHSLEKITVFDIVSIFESIDINDCVIDKLSCSYRNGECVVCESLSGLKFYIEEQLKQITIKELVSKQKLVYLK